MERTTDGSLPPKKTWGNGVMSHGSEASNRHIHRSEAKQDILCWKSEFLPMGIITVVGRNALFERLRNAW